MQFKLNNPRIWFDSEGNSYYFLKNLRKELDLLIDEIQAYLNGGKKGEPKPKEAKEDATPEADEADES